MRFTHLAPALLIAASAQASVTFSPQISSSYTDGNTFTSITGVTNANGGSVTADMFFWTPVSLYNMPSGVVSFTGWCATNQSPAGFKVAFFFSQPITSFSTNLQLNGQNGQSSVAISGYLNDVLLSTIGASATNPVLYDQIALDYSDAGGFDRLSIEFTTGPDIAPYWGLQLGVTSSPAVPEPSTYGLALGGLALAVVALRRRAKK